MYGEHENRAWYWAATQSKGEAESKSDLAKELTFHERVDRLLDDQYGLADMGKMIVRKWLVQMATNPQGLEHVRDWFLLQVNGNLVRRRAKLFDPWQLGCPDLIPGIRGKPFWGKEDTDLGSIVESWFPVVLKELNEMRGKPIFQPYRAPNWVNPDRLAKDGIGSLGHDSGEWDVCYLYLHNVNFEQNCNLFPETVAKIRSIKGWYCHAFFSVLSPNTHIAKHNGPTNKKLRIHLPLVVPEGEPSGIRVGGETKLFRVGEAIIFDDSFEHEAWNKHPSDPRICLIFDIWHPDLSDREVTLLKFLEKGKMKRAKAICSDKTETTVDEKTEEGDTENIQFAGNNFYSLLEHTKALAKSLVTIN